MSYVRILIVDDFQPWRQAISDLLHSDSKHQVVGEASDGLEAVCKSQQLRPDVILLDIGLPILNGLEAARRICAVSPNSRILFASQDRCQELIREALRCAPCVSGYVAKSQLISDLFPAIEAVLQARTFVSQEWVDPHGN